MFNFIKKWFRIEKSEDRKMIEEYEYQQRLAEIGQSDAQISRAKRTVEHLRYDHGFSGDKAIAFQEALEKTVYEFEIRGLEGDVLYESVNIMHERFKDVK